MIVDGINAVSHVVGVLGAAAPDVPAVNPPGWEKFLTLGGWVKSIVTLLAVIGFLIAGAMLALQDENRSAGATKRLGLAMGACVIIGVATQIVSALR